MVWNDYMHAYYYGIKKYLVGEDMSKLEQMRKKFKRLDILFLLFNFCVIILFIYLFQNPSGQKCRILHRLGSCCQLRSNRRFVMVFLIFFSIYKYIFKILSRNISLFCSFFFRFFFSSLFFINYLQIITINYKFYKY